MKAVMILLMVMISHCYNDSSCSYNLSHLHGSGSAFSTSNGPVLWVAPCNTPSSYYNSSFLPKFLVTHVERPKMREKGDLTNHLRRLCSSSTRAEQACARLSQFFPLTSHVRHASYPSSPGCFRVADAVIVTINSFRHHPPRKSSGGYVQPLFRPRDNPAILYIDQNNNNVGAMLSTVHKEAIAPSGPDT